MTVENATYINQLDQSLPTNVDLISQGDDHLRKIKSVLKNTFPNVAGAVTATNGEMSFLAGVTSGIQSQINTKAAKGGDAYTGTHNFTGASVTVAEPPPGDSSAMPATTAFVASTAFSSALPEQSGNDGKLLATNGSTAGWVDGATSHVHTTSQVTGLDTALTGKAPISHSHTTAQVTGLDTALAGKMDLAGTQTVTGAKTFTAGVKLAASNAWEIVQSGSDLLFRYNGANRFKLTSAGTLIVSGDMTSAGAP